MPAVVQRLSPHAFQATCSEHPAFRRVAWTHRAAPTSAARRHNEMWHDGAEVAVVDAPDADLQTLLP